MGRHLVILTLASCTRGPSGVSPWGDGELWEVPTSPFSPHPQGMVPGAEG